MKLDILLKYAILKTKYKRLKRESNILQRDFDYVFEENKILKQINRKRYVEHAKRMQFLMKRDNKCQMLETQQKEFIKYLEDEINEHKNKEPFIVVNICSSYDLMRVEMVLQ